METREQKLQSEYRALVKELNTLPVNTPDFQIVLKKVHKKREELLLELDEKRRHQKAIDQINHSIINWDTTPTKIRLIVLGVILLYLAYHLAN